MSLKFEQNRDGNFRSDMHLHNVKTTDTDFYAYNLDGSDCISLGISMPKTDDNGHWQGSDNHSIYLNIDQARYFAERLNLAIGEYEAIAEHKEKEKEVV